jgi:hypothetical protein
MSTETTLENVIVLVDPPMLKMLIGAVVVAAAD